MLSTVNNKGYVTMRLSKIEGAAITIERINTLRNQEFFVYTRPIHWKWRNVQKSFRRWIFSILKKNAPDVVKYIFISYEGGASEI